MKLKQIEKIAGQISKKHCMVDSEGKPLIIVERRIIDDVRFVEVRTEMPSYEGGNELIEKVNKKLGYYGENEGGCIYRFYKDDENIK